MSTGYQIKEQDKLHFVTLQVVECVNIIRKNQFFSRHPRSITITKIKEKRVSKKIRIKSVFPA